MYNIESRNTERLEANETRISKEFFFPNENVQEEQRLSARWLDNVCRDLSDCEEAAMSRSQLRSRPAAVCSTDASLLFLLSYNSTEFLCNNDNLRLWGSEKSVYTLMEDKGPHGGGRDWDPLNIEQETQLLF
jgi:hypothetical protein